MTPSRRTFLGTVALGTLGLAARAGGATTGPKKLVVMFADGGWDTTFSIDPKDPRGPAEGPWVDQRPNNPDDVERQATIAGIPLQLNDGKRRPVTRFFEEWGSRTCVVNGIWTGSIVHQPARIRMLTGTTSASNPDFATIVGVERGVSRDLPLGSIDFSGLGYTGDFAAKTGRIGHSAQLKALLDPASTFAAPPGAGFEYPVLSLNDAEEEALQAHLRGRVERVRRQVGRHPQNDRLLDDMIEAYERRRRLLEESEVLTRPLQLGTKPELALQAELAVDLLRSNLCHTVLLGEEAPVWDTHDLNHLQHERYQLFFAAANRLLDGLRRTEQLDETLVVLMSEMTRTPRRNAKTGKDHWSHTSIVLVGAGVAGGRVVGASNEFLESLPVDFESGEPTSRGELNKYDNLVAGLLAHMDIDPEAYLRGVRPFTAFTA